MYISMSFSKVENHLHIIDEEKKYIEKAWKTLNDFDISCCDENIRIIINRNIEHIERLTKSISAKREVMEEILYLFKKTKIEDDEHLGNIQKMLNEIR